MMLGQVLRRGELTPVAAVFRALNAGQRGIPLYHTAACPVMKITKHPTQSITNTSAYSTLRLNSDTSRALFNSAVCGAQHDTYELREIRFSISMPTGSYKRQRLLPPLNPTHKEAFNEVSQDKAETDARH